MTERVTVLLPAGLADFVRRRAEVERRSRAFVVRELIERAAREAQVLEAA
jgi:hypothetical protein